MKLVNFFRHLHTVNKHRFLVFKLCVKAGIPLQGLVHDLSKYSFVEFWEGVKYYQGTYSPIRNARKELGYSEAWLHHKGRNKHHYEYWYDYGLEKAEILMPYKYFAEMVCDQLAAGMVYDGKDWNNSSQLEYWMRAREVARIDERIDKALIKVYNEIKEKGVNKVINSYNLKKIYKEFVGE
ncbi:MAG: catalase [Bacilli bacterium]|nr:catalase [Bacilli bacterium]